MNHPGPLINESCVHLDKVCTRISFIDDILSGKHTSDTNDRQRVSHGFFDPFNDLRTSRG